MKMEADQLIVLLFGVCLAGVPITIWNMSTLGGPFLSMLSEVLSLMKLFGMAALVLLVIGFSIAIWEYGTAKWVKWKNPMKNESNKNYLKNKERNSTLDTGPVDRSKSLAPLLFVVLGLTLVGTIDMSFFGSSINYSLTRTTTRPSSSLDKSNWFQFTIALLTICFVISLVLTYKTDYRAWRARRRLLKLQKSSSSGKKKSYYHLTRSKWLWRRWDVMLWISRLMSRLPTKNREVLSSWTPHLCFDEKLGFPYNQHFFCLHITRLFSNQTLSLTVPRKSEFFIFALCVHIGGSICL